MHYTGAGRAQGVRRVSEDLEKRRKRISFRSWHRGTKEMDLLMGSFADRHLTDLDDAQLGRFEALLDLPEPVLYDWIIGREAPAEAFDHDVMTLLRNFKLSHPVD